jgi:hypothetical protein
MGKLREQLERRKADLRYYRKQAKDSKPHIMGAAVTAAGGAAAGFVQGSDFDTIAGIDTELILGALLVGFAVFYDSKNGDPIPQYAAGLGSGMLAVYAGDWVKSMNILTSEEV